LTQLTLLALGQAAQHSLAVEHRTATQMRLAASCGSLVSERRSSLE
jgi:hypothetical protein